MKKEEKYHFQFNFTPKKMISVKITNTKTGKVKNLNPSDYQIEGNILTLKKFPGGYFK